VQGFEEVDDLLGTLVSVEFLLGAAVLEGRERKLGLEETDDFLGDVRLLRISLENLLHDLGMYLCMGP
jgi:hypothetical protein